MDGLIPIDDLARKLGVERSVARKIAIGLGLQPQRRQILELGHRQRVSCWTVEQVDQILAARRRNGFHIPGDTNG